MIKWQVVAGPPSSAKPTLKASEGSDLAQQALRLAKAAYRGTLAVVSGNEIGQRVLVDKTLIVGRDPEADLVLTDELVSWHHARIEDRGDNWTVVDMGSTNGTSVNGERATEFNLKPGDKIVIGTTVIQYELRDAQEQQYDKAVDKLLNIDDLSGLYVRRKFDAEFNLMIEAARAKRETVALLVMDLDGVKGINDSHGHLFGAYVIGESGRVIATVLQTRGIACRFGGDEYLAALPGLDVDAAFLVAEEIRTAIGKHQYEREGVKLRPGISIGVSSFPESGDSQQQVFQKGDEALYRAKESGKNQVSR